MVQNMMIQLIVLKRINTVRNTVEIMVHHTIIMDHATLLGAVALVSALSKTIKNRLLFYVVAKNCFLCIKK